MDPYLSTICDFVLRAAAVNFLLVAQSKSLLVVNVEGSCSVVQGHNIRYDEVLPPCNRRR